MLSYLRRKKINPNDNNVRVDFVDSLGDKWQEFEVYHPKVKQWMEITGEKDLSKSPWHKCTAPEIDWIKRVELQAVCQKYTTHSISSTINLPNDVTVEKVGEIYLESWKKNLKGITIYRDGSRTGVLVSKDTKATNKEEVKENNSPKRPKELEADIHHVKIKGISWNIFIGKFDGKPYELFGGVASEFTIPSNVKDGILYKANKGMYGIKYENAEIEDIIKNFNNSDYGFHTRTISALLRHGVPIQYIIEQIQKTDKENTLYSFNKVIARVLKKYVKDGTKINGEVCSNCGATNSIVYQEGCKTCTSCGFGKCG
jgi:ribonucleoside-diphosphate reductase alpha chain